MDALVRYRLTEAATTADIDEALALLDADERRRYERLLDDSTRREFALAHALLRITLSDCAHIPPGDWRFEQAPGGKPRLPQNSPYPLVFSLSHTHGLVACIVASKGDVGIDVEHVSRSTDWRGIAKRYFATQEVAGLERITESDRQTRFYELWTLKEALAKTLGVSVTSVLSSARFTIEDRGRIHATLPEHVQAGDWRFGLSAPSPTHRCATSMRL